MIDFFLDGSLDQLSDERQNLLYLLKGRLTICIKKDSSTETSKTVKIKNFEKAKI